MTTQVYRLIFHDGRSCICIAMEPGSDEEHEKSIRDGFCGKVERVEKVVTKKEAPD